MRSRWLWIRLAAMGILVLVVVLAAPTSDLGGYAAGAGVAAWLIGCCALEGIGGRRAAR